MTNESHENVMMEKQMEYDKTTVRKVKFKDCE